MKKETKWKWKLTSQILTWMLVISMVVTGLPVQQAIASELPVQQAAAAEVSGFKDVSPTDWFYDAAIYVQQNGIFSGTGGGLFSPKGTLTRAMYVTALGRMAGVDVSEYTTTTFADVQKGIWYAPYVEWAAKNGITTGTGKQKFAPDATVSREQMATMTLRYFEIYQIPYQTSNSVTSEPGDLAAVSPWAVDAVVKLWQAGLFTGDGNGNFNPNSQASRAESAVLFMRNSAVVQAWVNQNPSTDTTKPESGGNTGGNSGGNTGGNGGGNLNDSQYIITFESNGGTAVTSQTVKYGTNAVEPVVPTKAGYTFGGWYSDSNLKISYSFTTTVTGKMTLYAKWLAHYTVSFDSNGGSAVAARSVIEGEAINNLPAPVKEGYIFQGWFRDSDLTLIFANGSTFSADTKLYAKYIDNVSNAVQSTPSVSLLDVAPNFTIAVNDESGNLTETDVLNRMMFNDIAADPVRDSPPGITVTAGANGRFTVASAAEDGLFEEGNTYQLTLTDDNLSFDGQDETTDIFVFSVAKQEAMTVPLNPNMIYLRFADVTNMMIDDADAGSLAVPVVSATVGDSANGLSAANATSGTFTYSGSTVIQVGDTVAIYEGVRPDERTINTSSADDGDVAYVKITAINGNTYTFGNADSKQVLFKPDILPVSITADEDGDPSNHSISVQRTVMNYSDILYAQFGLNELTTVDVGDFIGFYNGKFAEAGSTIEGYGRIESVTSAAELLIITYTDATMEDFQHAFDIYTQQSLEGDMLISPEDIAMLEDQIKRQAIDSGFVVQAADYLSTLAMQTEEFKKQPKAVQALSSDVGKVTVENVTVVPSIGTTLTHINGRTSGISATLQVGADIVIRIHEESDLVIHMTGTFLEEISLSLGVDGDLQGHWEYFWGIPYWYTIDDYVVTVNLDAYSYTGINVTAKIATVEHDKLQDALDDWDKAATGGMLGKIRDITTEIKALIDGVQDTDVDDESLREMYKEMMENDTDWVPLIKKELVSKSMRVALGIIEVNFTAEFVVNANVNLTVGADFNYTSAKRYSATLRVLSFTGKSDTVSLPGDGNYQFTFYVMGTLGLRAGIHMELKAGIGSVKLNSIGLAVEPGAYVNLWGYFFYQIKKLNGVESSRSLGALLVEIGIYLESSVGAQLGDGLLSASIPVYENTWPLYTVGEQQHVVDFAYSQEDAPTVNLRGSASAIPVPASLLTMSTFDLKTGEMDTQVYDRSRFDFQVDSRDFRYNVLTQKIEVMNPNIQVSDGNLIITWKGAPLSYSSEKLTRKVPLSWLARVGDYIMQLDPQNGEMTEVVAAPYNTEISVKTPTYQGYTFDGWYWAPTGSTKVTIPSRMPASDWTLYAHWIPNTNTPYTVQHYLIDPNTKAPAASPAATEQMTGTTGTEIQITSDKFRDQGYATATARGVIIKGDGSSVIKVYHYPVNRTMTFNWAYTGAPASSLTEAVGKNITARVTMPTRPGYSFAGWSPALPSMMPATDSSYTAQWTPKDDTSYQVVYLLQNIGSDTYTVGDTESFVGTTDTVASMTNPTKTFAGFTFDGTVAGSVLQAPIDGKGTTILKLYYKRNSYAMTINYNGSGALNNVSNVPFGATTELYLGTPTWTGHTFTGWSPANQTTMPAQAVTFTAQWSLNTHTVSFDSKGGSTVANQTVGYGSKASEPTVPTKDDLVFGGWYSDSALTSAYDFETQVTADITLYAKWQRSYTVSFYSDGGSAVADKQVIEGAKTTAPAAPTLEDYVFGGWYKESSLTNVFDFDVETVTTNITLYAKWTLAPKTIYTVSFNSYGGTTVDDLTAVEGSVATAPTAPTKTGHSFAGWYTDSGLTSSFSFSTPIMSNLTLNAKWTINTYTVSFASNSGSAVANQTVSYDGTATQPTAPTRSGYVFSGWYSDAALTTTYNFGAQVRSNITLYAKWTAVYTVSFTSNGGTSVASQSVEHGNKAVEPTAPTKPGYTFRGWYSDDTFTEAYSFTERQVISSITLYAKWTFDSYTVTFESNGGPAVQSQEVVPGGTAEAPAKPKRVGYRFDGWFSDDAFENVYDFSTAVNGAITLYAKWTKTSWVPLGEIAPRANYHSNLVLDSQGTAYVAFQHSSDNTVYVKKYVKATDEWQDVGALTELAKTWGQVNVSLAIDNEDTLYVAYVDDTMKTIVKKFVDGHWVNVVDLTQEFSDYVTMAFDEDNTPYFAYHYGTVNTYYSIAVKKLVNGSLVPIDSMGASKANDINLEFDGDTLYLFYTNYLTSTETRANLVKYEGSTHAKTVLSQPPSPSNGTRASFAISPTGVPYMTYVNDNKVYVSKLENDTWQPVGTATAGFPINYDGYYLADIAFDSAGIPYVAYVDVTLGNSMTLMKFDNNAWSVVEYAGVSPRNTYTNRIKLLIDSNDKIYVNFIVATSNVKSDGKETVMKYDPDL
ncbi:MAG: InlB B-repeat-containing protein [Candidatus Cohnella colombiensis]|uniref:InlB B-repeat-containing protein n=1 Tax=Candidatus Cohnella colombiensis TaxID=3121368 RepID=A0AA95EYY7_9BACL|nr:MAG: InlB B-repeat-containing protein [Cohnella sp.]